MVDPMMLSQITIFAIKIKGKEFEIRYHYTERLTEVYYYTKQLDPTSIDAFDKHHVHMFPFIADFTPFNAKEKLQRLLVFM